MCSFYLNFGFNITRDPGLRSIFGAGTMVIPEATYSGIVDSEGNYTLRMPIGVTLPGPFYVQAFHFFPIYGPLGVEFALIASNVIKIEPRN